MALKKHEVFKTNFDVYYDQFLKNFLKNKTYRLKLKSETKEIVGIPWCGSFIDFKSPEFFLKILKPAELEGNYDVPFDDIISAEMIPE